MKLKAIFLSVILLFTCTCIVGCKQINIFQYHTSMYDDKEKLTSDKSSYSYLNKDGVVDEKQAEIEFSFSGHDILWKIVADEDTKMSFSYNMKISEGNFKIILVSEKEEILTILENIDEDEIEGTYSLEIPKGENMIKIVGNKAIGTLEMNLSYEDEISIEPISFIE